MTPTGTDQDPLDELIEHFLDRYRAGEKPDVEEYAGGHPELAERIRTLFPALVTLEALGSVVGGPSGSVQSVGPGTVLGEYRLVREIGRGGMGVVYEAVQETLGRPVALKVMAVGTQGAGRFLDRFRREARTAAKLHHTNIVPVFGVGADKGVYFYAMQYIRGQSLSAVLNEVRRLRNGSTAPVAQAETPMDEISSLSQQPPEHYYREVTRLALQAADALAYAHGQGVLHRDIKPSNLLLDADGTLWIADFGLAKADDADDLTESGALVGTPRYMAPERFRGPGDARSDVYSLGATLYEMLTLRPAFDAAERPHLIEQITAGRPPRPRSLNANIPPDLETVVLHTIAREPADRYSSAAALADDLRNVLADRPVSVRRPSWATQGARWCRRNPVVAGLASVAFALLLTIVGVSEAKNQDLRAALKDKDDALGAKETAFGEKQAALKDKNDALGAKTVALSEREAALWRSLVEQARVARLSSTWDARVKSLDALKQAAAIRPDPSLRSDVILSLDLDAIFPSPRKPGPMPDQEELTQFPPGFLLAKSGFRRAASSNPPRQPFTAPLPPTPTYVASIRYEGNTRHELRTDDAQGDKWYLFESAEAKEPLAKIAPLWNPGVPDTTLTRSGKLVYRDKTGKLRVYRAADGTELASWGPIEAATHQNFRFAIGPKTESSVVVSFGHPTGEAFLQVRDLLTGDVKTTIALPFKSADPRTVAMDPKSDLIAVGSSEGPVLLFDLRTGLLHASLPGRQNSNVLCFHPTHEMMLVGTDRSIDVWDCRRVMRLASFQAPRVLDACFSPDGRWIGWSGARRYGLALSSECRWFVRENEFLEGRVAFTRDSSLLVCGSPGRLSIYDLQGRRPPLETKDCHNLELDPVDDSLLVASEESNRYVRRVIQLHADRIELGPAIPIGPDRFGRSKPIYEIGKSKANGCLAYYLPSSKELVVEHPERPALRLMYPDLIGLTVSTSGRFLATKRLANKGASTLTILASETGKVLYQNSKEQFGRSMIFSPDDSTFAIHVKERNGNAIRFIRTSDWATTGTLKVGLTSGIHPIPMAYSEDGSLFAVYAEPRIQLFRTTDMALVMSWEEPRQVGKISFSPDNRLLALAGDGVTVRDLALVRRQLRAMNLDWDPPFPEAPSAVAGQTQAPVVHP